MCSWVLQGKHQTVKSFYFSSLDVSIQYVTFRLDPESQNVCFIFTSFGLNQYKHLFMGITQFSDIIQEGMETLHWNLDDDKM